MVIYVFYDNAKTLLSEIKYPLDSLKRNIMLMSILSLFTLIILISIARPKELFDSLTGIKLRYIGYVILLYILRISLKIWRWHILVNATGTKVSLKKTSLYCIIGISLNNITPIGLGGEPVKTYLLKTEANVHTGKALASIFTERIMDLIVLTSLATIGIAMIFSELAPEIRLNMLYPLIIIIGVIILVFILISHPNLLDKFGKGIGKIISRFSKSKGAKFEIKTIEMIHNFKISINEIFRNKKSHGIFCFILTISICLIQALRLYIILIAMNIEFQATFTQVVIVSSIATMFGVVLPWGAGNIAAITAVFTTVGISLENATAVGILDVLTSVWIMVPCGIIAMLLTGIKSHLDTNNNNNNSKSSD